MRSRSLVMVVLPRTVAHALSASLEFWDARKYPSLSAFTVTGSAARAPAGSNLPGA